MIVQTNLLTAAACLFSVLALYRRHLERCVIPTIITITGVHFLPLWLLGRASLLTMSLFIGGAGACLFFTDVRYYPAGEFATALVFGANCSRLLAKRRPPPSIVNASGPS